ncbi:MAG: hypothetical protein U9N02_04780 [Campylobacterota bacterium]|nr:hypothetical protein [Campylobacterota bacterium]
MKKLLLLAILIISLQASNLLNLQQNILKNIEETEVLHGKTIAIYNIDVVGSDNKKLKYISTQSIMNTLIKSKLVKVVERNTLKAYIEN